MHDQQCATTISKSVINHCTCAYMQHVTVCPAGGANVPALNELLAPFGIAFGDAILEGQVPLEPDKPYYASGANIVRFPAGGHLHGWQLADKATEGVHCNHHFPPQFCVQRITHHRYEMQA